MSMGWPLADPRRIQVEASGPTPTTTSAPSAPSPRDDHAPAWRLRHR